MTANRLILAGISLAFALLATAAVVSYRNTVRLIDDARSVAHTREVLSQLEAIASNVRTAEANQRGFLLTGDPAYLGPYDATLGRLHADLDSARKLTADNASQQQRLSALDPLVESRLELLRVGIETYRSEGADAARDFVRANNALHLMDEIRDLTEEMKGEELRLLALRSAEAELSTRTAVATLIGGNLLAIVLVAGAISLLLRETAARRRAEARAVGLNEQLAQRVVALDAVNRELEAFSYSVSHDLRAPLRSIDGFSQALLEDYSDRIDADGQDYLRRVRASSQRMAQLIDDLLGLSRVTRSELSRQQVDLSALARSVAGEIRHHEPDRRVEIVVHDGLTASADPRLLRILLENLIGNAWKFTAKAPEAHIEVGAEGKNGERVYYVKDNGVGFDMAYADKLFGAFQRLHAMTEFEGTGIGLATVQRVVSRHGGRIWAESAVERGATFYFTL
jgi:signal transduction histidine kinase